MAGLTLTYALQTLDVTQYAVRMASEVETLMTSVERVMSYTQIESEPGYGTESHPSDSWPKEGNLAIKDLSLVYFEGGPRVLKNINVCVSSKEKVGVVGRTGAGKSSLVSALFRMPDPLGKVSHFKERRGILDYLSCNLTRNLLRHKFHEMLSPCSEPISRNIFVAASVALSRNKLYLLQLLRQRSTVFYTLPRGVTLSNVLCNLSQLRESCTKYCICGQGHPTTKFYCRCRNVVFTL